MSHAFLITEISATSQRRVFRWVEFDVKHLLGVWGEHGLHVGSGFHVQNWVSALDSLLTGLNLFSQGGKDKRALGI